MDSLGAKFQELVHLGQNLLQSSAVSIILTILALLSANLWYFYKPYWGVRRVPGPPALPLVGHLPLLAKYGPDVFSVLAKQYGPVFRFHMGRQPMIVVADAELCREAGIKKFKDLTNRSIPFPVAASPLHQKGLFFSNTDKTSREKSWNINCVPFGWAASPETISLHKVLGEATHPDEKWSSMRNTILSVYQPSHLAKLIPTMQSYIESASANLETQGDIEFSELSLKLATDIIGKTAFGVDFCLSKLQADKDSHQQDDEEVQEFIKQHIYSTTQLKMDLSGSLSMTLGILMPILQEPFRRILERIPGTMDRKVDLINLNLANRLDEIVTKKMKEKDRGSKDFLSLILNAMESHTTARNAFTPDYISAVSYEHLLAGSATTSFTLSTIIYLVAGHPEVEKKLFREIDEFGPLDQIPTADDLQNKFSYLDQVVKEAMRFYTMSPLVARETSRLVEIGGYILPKGTWVWLAPGILAKDPKNFPEPDKFKPERFDPDCEEHKRRHPYAHIPFGIGPRSCIGQKFSIQEIKLSLIHFYRRYAFRHSSGMKVPLELEYGIIMSFKNGLKVRAIKRA